jgi:osmoprotectant transport system ATP-binding protein
VIFVTHDIDEAIKMGNRIAILREGGSLAQYDTPDAILAEPADDFVARFVGADRGLKRLSLVQLSDLELEAVPAEPNGLPTAAIGTSLRDALSLLLSEGQSRLLVTDGDGNPVGVAKLEQIGARVSAPEDQS